MALDKTFAVYTSLLQKKYTRSQESLEQYDIRSKDVNVEYELRFNDINKIKFQDIHKKLLGSGFVLQQEQYYLKVSNYINNVRCEIEDLTNIKNFCKNNLLPTSTKYIIKERFKEYPDMIDNNDYNFRISIQKEISLKESDLNVKQLLKSWSSTDRSYRYMNRVTLIHPKMPGIIIDLSVVKSAKRDDRLLKEKDFGVSKLFEMPEGYEIEVELKPEFNSNTNSKEVISKLLEDLKKTIKYICSGIQSSNFPISATEQHTLAYEYYSLFTDPKGRNPIERFIPNSGMFIGPSSYTLQKINLVDDQNNTAPCVLYDFCVTDKADGDRKMLFIAGNSKIYFITSNMNIQYTGAICRDKNLWGLLLDGEHILYDKKKQYINLYAAFDIYFISGKSVRSLPFVSDTKGESYRYKLLQDKITKLNETIEYQTKEQLHIESKRFAVSTEEASIQECCEHLFTSMSAYRYNTDGLIFTSKTLGVGKEDKDDKVKNYKYTWKHSFKWKPPEFNTIDFLVKVKKTFGNKDEIKNIFYPETQSVEQFKILNLYVGWDDSTHGIMNPQDVLFRGDIPTLHSERKGLTPQLFVPSSPYDETAHTTYLPLKNENGIQNMFTEEDEAIETDTIVEFKYEFNENMLMRWKPLRVRYDKTAEYKNTNSIFGNAYHVANSNWQTIHNPITREMLIDRELDITMDDIDDKDVYYNKAAGPSKTVNLRDFHNMYVKKILIDTVSGPNKKLIDFAVGKAGDLQKWIHSKTEFVLGIDISKDNIHNKKDGACARYIGVKQKNKQIPNALFIQGDSSKLILQSLTNDTYFLVEDPEEDKKSKFVLKQVLGIGKPDEKYGKYLSKQFGVANKMFDVASIQFAIHYMFENKFTLHNFLKNVSDLVKPGGYFTGTCYDGSKIFKLLEDVEENDSKDIFVGSKKIWSVIKKYDNTLFPETLGLKIGVYQETINKVFDEYLVDFRYLIQLLEQYGFRLESPVETIPPIGEFNMLYKKMRAVDQTITMTEEECQISFLNNYFIFKKVQNVDTAKVHEFHTRDQVVSTDSISVPVRLFKKIILKGT
jgi:SAM-dependent methyltransferase